MNRQRPYLIVGLGNPGREYVLNRHNVGFRTVDHLADKLEETLTKMRMDSLFTTARYRGHRLILAKPQTYMNKSGSAVSSLQRFYNVPLDRLLVIYDDVDLPFESLRLRAEGGAGGQKGLQSIIQELGTDQFPRLRIGIGRPPGRMSVSDYVLRDFTNEENDILIFILDRAVNAVFYYIKDGIQLAMTEFNSTPDS